MFSRESWFLTLTFVLITKVSGVYISNLSESCGRCLCEAATACNTTIGCNEGYCGPFHISKVYWVDSGKVVLPEDEPIRAAAYPDCANDYNCGLRIVAGYLTKFAKDCNGDGVTDCEDYVMTHYNGGYSCEKSIENTRFYRRYRACTVDVCVA